MKEPPLFQVRQGLVPLVPQRLEDKFMPSGAEDKDRGKSLVHPNSLKIETEKV